MAGKGDNLENEAKKLFEILLEELGYSITKSRKQKSGTQDGFDNEIIIIDKYLNEHSIYIEYKDYSTKLNYSEAIVKIPQIISSYEPDILIFLSPKKPFSNPYNDTRLKNFYDQFEIPIEFLTPDNFVEELIALEPKIYENIYGYPLNFEVDREKVIQRFDRFIHSRKPLRKIVLREENSSFYLTNIEIPKDYIERYVSCPTTDSTDKYFTLPTAENTLLSIIASFLASKKQNIKGIVLLGNPGSGKSIELKRIALHYWQHREVLDWVPFFREIKNFTQSDQIISFLPENWKEIPRLLIILDGLDEIHHSQSFRSKLEKFITDTEGSKNKIKFILSCRTNIYEHVIRDIVDFEIYLLNTIPLHQSLRFLKEKVGLLPEDARKLNFKNTQREFLENPYYLRIFARYYKEHQKLPANKSELLKTFVESRLVDDRKKFRDKPFESSSIKSVCKKIALAMEAMQINEITIARLQALVPDQANDFTESSFSTKVYQKEFWKFEHRNLQEYFAAKALAGLSFELIIKFIQLDDQLPKVHPSWVHTLSYLLGILDKDDSKFKKLLSWLQKHDPNVLFKADADRIPKQVRLLVFKEYYKQQCKIDTLWAGYYGTDINELAQFACYGEVVDFLIIETEDLTNHRRARISAIELIAYMDIRSKKEAIKGLTMRLLKAPIDQVNLPLKAIAIKEFGKLHFYKDTLFISEVIEALGDIDFHHVTSAVLRLIVNVEVDDFFDYVKKISIKVIFDNKRLYPKTDNLNTFEESTLEEILTIFKKGDHAVFALDFYLEHRDFHRIDSKQESISKILDTLVSVIPEDNTILNQVIIVLFKQLDNGNIDYHRESLFFSVFEKTETRDIAFDRIYTPDHSFRTQIGFLTHCATKKSIYRIIDDFISEKLTPKNITHFRNSLSYKDMSLALLFQSEIETKTNFHFESALSLESSNAWSNHHKNKPQKNFDLLFKKETLLKLTNDYFMLIGEDTITWKNRREYGEDFYNNLELQSKYYDSFMTIVHLALQYGDGCIEKESVKQLIREDLFLLSQVKSKLTERLIYFKIKEDQIVYIKAWCFTNLPLCDFKTLATNTTQENKLRCELVWFFRHRFDFKFPSEFLVELLLIDGKIEFNGKNLGYDYIKIGTNKEALDARVIYNINNETLSPLILENHISYSIDQKLTEVYPFVKEYFKGYSNKKNYSRSSRLFYSFTEKVIDIPFLKELVKPHPSDPYLDGLSWEAIRILIFNGEIVFVVDTLLEFRKQDVTHENLLIVIKFLIMADYQKAFLFFNEWLSKSTDPEKQIRSMISTEDYLMHKNIHSIPYLLEVFKTGHNSIWDTYTLQYHPRKIAHETIKNICEINDISVCKSVLIQLDVAKKELEAMAVDLFYINDFIRDIKSIYYKYLSNPMEFGVVCEKIEEIKYKFL